MYGCSPFEFRFISYRLIKSSKDLLLGGGGPDSRPLQPTSVCAASARRGAPSPVGAATCPNRVLGSNRKLGVIWLLARCLGSTRARGVAPFLPCGPFLSPGLRHTYMESVGAKKDASCLRGLSLNSDALQPTERTKALSAGLSGHGLCGAVDRFGRPFRPPGAPCDAWGPAQEATRWARTSAP